MGLKNTLWESVAFGTTTKLLNAGEVIENAMIQLVSGSGNITIKQNEHYICFERELTATPLYVSGFAGAVDSGDNEVEIIISGSTATTDIIVQTNDFLED